MQVKQLLQKIAKRPQQAESKGLGPWHYSGHPDQPFGPISYAQFGEDLIILNWFEHVKLTRPSYLDIGAHHPFNCSNTALLYSRGSRGVCVEANPNLIAAFSEMRPEDVILNMGAGSSIGEMDFFMIDDRSGRNTFDRITADEFVATNPLFKIRETKKITVMPIDDIVEKYCHGIWPDLLSLDAEGLDYAILRGSQLTADRGPRIICVETISGGGTSVDTPLTELLLQRGYFLFGQTIANMIWCAPSRNEEGSEQCI